MELFYIKYFTRSTAPFAIKTKNEKIYSDFTTEISIGLILVVEYWSVVDIFNAIWVNYSYTKNNIFIYFIFCSSTPYSGAHPFLKSYKILT
jgi:hypothetical protein